MLCTRLCELLSIEYPIIQGGLAYLARAELCAAVSEAGGLGQITAATLGSPEELREEIRKVRALTRKPFGVNFAMGYRSLEPYIDAALEEGVRIVTITGGNPEPYMKYIDARVPGVMKIILVAGVRAAQKAEALGADAVIAVGYDGGGHLGRDDVGTMALIPRIVDSVKIPVAASGGIVDGRGLMAALALGADGIEMGTRFVAVQECPAHEAYKQLLLETRENETVIMERSIGRPARVLRTGGALRVLEAEARGATLEELLPLISGKVNARAALEGDMEEGFVYAGQGVGLIHDIPTVAELFARILAEARAIGERLRGLGV
ncbi:NAD(P)H-dependent flavin oxidoreductase [Symbiobacterium thermophilum]|uniref:Probable nitronate monooxygenase n=2 Tax=Symbiobacterium thermophilum TaxID=2734 RepID=Q67L90_SYMTH|nr:nitronate monooxygenase [Symbiobacterium thermophilum]BAD41556.1 putative enoyl-(acyl-carrier-protein) reductase [Symbiobacterium thermophilum IAM 14863]